MKGNRDRKKKPKKHRLTIEEALVKPKIQQPPPSGIKTSEIKNYQTPIKEVPVVPGEKSYSKATRSDNNVFNTIILRIVYKCINLIA